MKKVERSFVISLIGLALFLSTSSAFAQRTKSGKPAAQPAASLAFDKIAAQAKEAREAGNLDEAIKLYRKAVALRPKWEEGQWYLATLLYDRDEYAEAARAFKQVAAMRPQVGAPVAMQGLCEYRLGQYDEAFIHLQQGRQRGIGDNKELLRVMAFHEATLFLLRSDFETAQRIFTGLSRDGGSSQDLIIGMGLAVLRISALPKQIDASSRERDLIRRAGLAQHYFAQLNAADARTEYDRLVADYPKTPNVQYAYGRFLIDTRDDEAGLAAFKREIENSPKHVLARLQYAYIKIRNKEPEAGIPLAQEAVLLNPRLPLAHYILGRCLFETGENAKSIEELEAAQKTAPSEPRIYYTLARAYAKAGRSEDAERARETFARLNKMAEDAAQRGDGRGEAIEEKEREPIKP
jgi:tetratricopeptide (TPR) repeat protein